MIVWQWDYLDFLDEVRDVEYLIEEEQKAIERGGAESGKDDFPDFSEYELPAQKVHAARAKDPRASEIFDMSPDQIANFWGEDKQ